MYSFLNQLLTSIKKTSSWDKEIITCSEWWHGWPPLSPVSSRWWGSQPRTTLNLLAQLYSIFHFYWTQRLGRSPGESQWRRPQSWRGCQRRGPWWQRRLRWSPRTKFGHPRPNCNRSSCLHHFLVEAEKYLAFIKTLKASNCVPLLNTFFLLFFLFGKSSSPKLSWETWEKIWFWFVLWLKLIVPLNNIFIINALFMSSALKVSWEGRGRSSPKDILRSWPLLGAKPEGLSTLKWK